ncbi:hypothetical protein HDU98_007651 [Podochytrium sp. JEL0797]|nr:hypothetical protein HDU98_007651 [Podochytrium sp. JEL0797]
MLSTTETPKDDSKWPFVAIFDDFTETNEVLEPVECVVEGSIPNWLSGQLYRTGPGVFSFTGNGRKISMSHWFDGIGVTHLFQIHTSGTVTYRNCITGKARKESLEKNGVLGATFGPSETIHEDPCKALYKKVMTTFGHPDQEGNMNTTISPRFVVPGKDAPICVIRTDANGLQIIDPVTLKPIEKSVANYGILDAALGKGTLSAAHEEFDPLTNSFINLVATVSMKPEYIVFDSPQSLPAQPTTILAKFRDSHLAYQHSFSSTRKYIVIQLWPVAFGLKGLKIMKTGNLTGAMEWDPKRKTRMVVIDRAEKKVVAEYQHEADFCFHTVNAFDDAETGDVVMDLLMCKTGEVVMAGFGVAGMRESSDATVVDRIRELSTTRFTRIRLPGLEVEKSKYVQGDVMSKTAPHTQLVFDNPISMELPRINQAWRHRPDYRFAYGVSTMFRHLHSHALFDSLVKFDTSTQKYLSWYKVGHSPSEPMFVANPHGDGSEDDGVVLSVVLDGSLTKSYLLVLDAKTFLEIAKADIGQALPYGFHGAFV